MANVPTDPPTSRTIDYGALVRKALGDEFHKHETVYQFDKGRKFESSDYGTAGIYRAAPSIVRSGTSTSIGTHFIELDTSANGSPHDYVGHRITGSRSTADVGTFTGVDYNVTSRILRIVPAAGDGLTAAFAAGARTNLCLQSENLATSWAPTRATVSVNQTTAPDGTLTADKLIEDNSASTTHSIAQGITVTNGVSVTTSIFAKAAERSWVRLVEANTVTAAAYFDLTTGVVGTVSGTGSPSATIKAYPNGWYRCTLTFTSAGTTVNVQVQLATGNGGASYSGDGTSGAYLWGGQGENNVSFASSYIPTTTVAVTRDSDGFTYQIAP